MQLATTVDFQLNTGAKIPALGLGTVPPQDASEVKQQVITAVKAGYRHIDCAWYYQLEKYVGEALQQLFKEGYKREDLFITTKVWPLYWQNVEKLLDELLADLQLDYVDLFLQHWPVEFASNENGQPSVPRDASGKPVFADDPVTGTQFIHVYHELERVLQETKKTRAIGVSNYATHKLKQLLKEAKVVPAVNQIEYHPQLPQQDIYNLCKQHGIVVVAYSPVGSLGAPVLKLELVQMLAEKYGVTVNEIANAYNILDGRCLIPRLSNLERIRTNVRLPALTKDELNELYQIGVNDPQRHINDDWGYGLGFRWWKGDTLSPQFE